MVTQTMGSALRSCFNKVEIVLGIADSLGNNGAKGPVGRAQLSAKLEEMVAKQSAGQSGSRGLEYGSVDQDQGQDDHDNAGGPGHHIETPRVGVLAH